MKVRTFVIILFLMLASYALAELAVRNQGVLQQDVRLWGGASLPVGLVMLASLLAGFLITLAFGISREIGLMIERWRHRQTIRKTDEIEEHYSRALVAVLEGREEDSLRHFRAVLELDSRHFNTLLKLGEVLRGQGRYDDAIELHRKAQNLKEEDSRPLYALCEDHEAKGDMDRARAVLGKILALNKSSVSAWRKLRSLLAKEGRWDEALGAHEKVQRYGVGSDLDGTERNFGRGIRFEMAGARLDDGRHKEAISHLRRLTKEDPSFIPAHVSLGEALVAVGQTAQGVEAWFEGFEATGSPIFLTALEEHYLGREEPLAAIEALKRCVSRSTKDTLPRFYLGKLYFRLEMLDDAQSVFSSLQGRATYAPTLHYLLGRIHERRKNHRDAAYEYRRVIKELELIEVEYRCRACRAPSVGWTPRCSDCGTWNTVEVDFREEISLEELGLSPAPVYTIRED